MSDRAPDVLIIGDGVIGLSTALAVSRIGGSCTIVGVENSGMASAAAAGLLAPSIGTLEPRFESFFLESLRSYDKFLAPLREFDPTLGIVSGLIEICGPMDVHSGGLRDAEWLHEVEPTLVAPFGAIMHPHDGAIDSIRLLTALRRAVVHDARIRRVAGPATEIILDRTRPALRLADSSTLEAEHIVLAAGAWSGQLHGLPREVPVSPLKGQMLSVASTILSRPVMGNDVYLVPRDGEIAIGATVERDGFDTTVHPEAIAGLHRLAAELCPPLADAPVIRSWAGVRPATPDMRPIIGRDPDVPALIYACGHSKNGLLLAPATSQSVAALACGQAAPHDLDPFSIARFG